MHWSLLPRVWRPTRWAAEPIDFSRDVRPILSNKCFYCHGPDPTHREADLRLDVFSETDGVRGAQDVIVLGHPEESLLLDRVFAEDEADRMPPTDSGKELTPEQTETLKRWIAEGVEYQPHWSLIPPERPELPAVKDAAWVRNPIDRFVLARLDAEGLTPSPKRIGACSFAGCRSILLGLPPSAEEVKHSWRIERNDAYEQSGRSVAGESRISASGWRSIGSMRPAMPIPTAIRSTAAGTCGCGAIG